MASTSASGPEVTLFSAAGAGDLATVREMLEGDLHRVHSLDNNGYSALHWAALYDRYEVARYLLDSGADITGKGQLSLEAEDDGVKSTASSSISNPSGIQPIHWSCQAGNVKLAMLLVEHGADVEARDAQGYQPIHFAAQASKSLMLHYLVLKGANVNARDYSDRTPLHWAAYHNRTENITYLLSRSADINAVDSQLCSPLHWAAMRGCDSAAQLLIENRCNSRLVDAQGCTAKTLAMQCKQTGVAQTLTELENFGYSYVYPLLKGRPFLYLFVCLLPFILEVVPTYLWFTNESYWIRALIVVMAFALFSLTAHWHMPRNVVSPFPFVHVLQTGALMYVTWYYRMTEVPWYWLHVILNIMHAGFWIFGLSASFTNAGHFRGPPVTLENIHDLLFAQGMREEMFCPTCLHWRPNRSKHCRVCDKCTARFDHHCPWVNNCIGFRNNKFFILFLMSALIAHATYVPLSYFVLITDDVPSMIWAPFQCAWYLYEHKPWVTLVLWTSNLHASWEVMLLAEQLMCAMLNVTINERLNKTKYYWLLDAEGRFFNHYNRGIAANFYEVFIAPPVDYTKPHIIPTADWRGGSGGIHDA